MMHAIPRPYKQFTAMAITAFLVRALFFIFFVQHEERYKQPDSLDYHGCSVCVATGNGMTRPDNQSPIFWRTPGYPAYLGFFYKLFGYGNGSFSAAQTAQKASIWFQIVATSLIPIIVFFLGYMLTSNYLLALIAAWIMVFHLGIALASTYLLTDALAAIFFYLFLFFLYRLIIHNPARWVSHVIFAALTLSIYTWMRPMGEVVALVSTGLLGFCSYGAWQLRLKRAALFFGIFALSVAPWYVRNYRYTHDFFFSPTIGIYLNCFCVPKIIRTVADISINDAYHRAQSNAHMIVQREFDRLRGTDLLVSPLISKNVAIPVIKSYPLIFLEDWAREVCKTTFDLYGSQLTAFASGSFYYDPLEEFLSDKVSACLWTQEMPHWMRSLCWLEFLFYVLVWFAIFAGLWTFLIAPFFERSAILLSMQWLWFTTGILIGAVIGPSGGFGYARLRIPVEPLIIILALTFWFWLFDKSSHESISQSRQ